MNEREKAFKRLEELKTLAMGFLSMKDKHAIMSMYYDIIIYIEELEKKLNGYIENDMGL